MPSTLVIREIPDEVVSALDSATRAAGARSREAFLREHFQRTFVGTNSGIANRLRTALDDLVQLVQKPGYRVEPPTVVSVSRMLGLPDTSTLDGILRGDIPVPFAIAEMIAQKYAISTQWLLEGQGYPFAQYREFADVGPLFASVATDEKRDRKFHVVLEDDVRGEVSIFEEIDDWHWSLSVAGVPGHGEVGGTGGRMLRDLGVFLAASEMHVLPYRRDGFIARPDDYRALIHGAVHPMALGKLAEFSYWDSDFWDIDRPGRQGYTRGYDGARARLLSDWSATSVNDAHGIARPSDERIRSNERLREHIVNRVATIRRHSGAYSRGKHTDDRPEVS